MKDDFLQDTGERILPAREGETSLVFSRHKFAYEYASRFVEGRTVLDVGCGTGYGCHILAQKAKRVCGVDYSQDAIAYCQRHYAAPNITFLQQDALHLKIDEAYDVAVSFQVIEHLPDLSLFIRALQAAVKPNGLILISTPRVPGRPAERNRNPFHENEMSYDEFYQLISRHFQEFEILGVAYARRNRLRSLITSLPIYRWGRRLGRRSKLKRLASQSLALTEFKIIAENVEKEAADLLAVCRNNAP